MGMISGVPQQGRRDGADGCSAGSSGSIGISVSIINRSSGGSAPGPLQGRSILLPPADRAAAEDSLAQILVEGWANQAFQ